MLGPPDELGQAAVDELGREVGHQHHVSALDVSVEDGAARGGARIVEVGQGRRDAARDGEAARPRELRRLVHDGVVLVQPPPRGPVLVHQARWSA